MTHPALHLDDTVHQRVRLGILAVLTEAGRAEFTFIREALELSDGNLSRHLAVLQEAGLVEIDKAIDGKRPRTWVAATAVGRSALEAELAAMRELIARVENGARARA